MKVFDSDQGMVLDQMGCEFVGNILADMGYPPKTCILRFFISHYNTGEDALAQAQTQQAQQTSRALAKKQTASRLSLIVFAGIVEQERLLSKSAKSVVSCGSAPMLEQMSMIGPGNTEIIKKSDTFYTILAS